MTPQENTNVSSERLESSRLQCQRACVRLGRRMLDHVVPQIDRGRRVNPPASVYLGSINQLRRRCGIQSSHQSGLAPSDSIPMNDVFRGSAVKLRNRLFDSCHRFFCVSLLHCPDCFLYRRARAGTHLAIDHPSSLLGSRCLLRWHELSVDRFLAALLCRADTAPG